MKRDDVKKIFSEATEEQLNAIMSLNGADIEKEKSKRITAEDNLKKTNEELGMLKNQSDDNENWKDKYEKLKEEIAEKARKADEEKLLQEKEKRNHEYFDNALKAIGKTKNDWNGKYTETGYYNEFVKAIEAEENAGKAHKDVLHDLVKNDQNAFKGVTVVKLAGGTPQGNGKYKSRDEIMSIKDKATRLNEMVNNPQFFPELNE